MVHVPSLAKDHWSKLVLKREKVNIYNKSGVSARMSITAYENLLSTAERRALRTGVDKTTYVCLTLWEYTHYR
jgi:magnesium chelatase subunit I